MKKGFTLIEFMALIMIVSLVAAVVVPAIMSKRESLSEEKTLNKDKNGYDTPVYSLKKQNTPYYEFYVINVQGCQYLTTEVHGGFSAPVHLVNCTNCTAKQIMLEKGERK